MIDSKTIDSSIWIAYLFENKNNEILEDLSTTYLSTISLFEIKKILIKKNIPKKLIDEKISHVKRKSIVIEVTKEIAEKAAEISQQHNLHTADAIIYTTSLINNTQLITLDNDFRNLEKAIVLN